MGLFNLSLSHHEPLFGLDIGRSSMKIMQLHIGSGKNKRPRVVGYGNSQHYDVNSIANGVIVNQKALSEAMHDLFDKRLAGAISTRKVACTIPLSQCFSRPIRLPLMTEQELDQAVQLEAEQYIPVSSENLYLDYDIVRKDSKNIEILLVATPRNIVESYMQFLQSMGLEPVTLEPTMNATARIFGLADRAHDAPTILIDFGATTIDIGAFDKTLFVNNTMQGGSDTMIDLIAKKLGISHEEAYIIKNKDGIKFGEHLRDISTAIQPILDSLVREVQKIIRYYNDRMASIGLEMSQAITTGGGANMPGLNEFLSKQLEMPVRPLDPWSKIDFGSLPLPNELERSMFITVAGEAILDFS